MSEAPAKPLALYLHVPFCRQRCAYCHFQVKILHPQTNRTVFHENYTSAVIRELIHYGTLLEDRPLTSIFFGGGTPSQLGLAHLRAIMDTITRHFKSVPNLECTLEVNPEDASDSFLSGIAAMGVNRVSFGIQTFDDRGLRAINRPHDGTTAVKALQMAKGFQRGVSMDLILGIPYQTRQTLERDLTLALENGLDHMALYLLERDSPTPLDKKAADVPDDDRQADFYEQVHQRLTLSGYDHYEISNFCKPGLQSRHNQTYWQCGDYIGVGPAAHGRLGLRYRQNHDQLKDYRNAVAQKGLGTAHEQTWTEERYRQERVIQGLRLQEGVPLEWLQPREREQLELMISAGLLSLSKDRCALTLKGRLLANEVFALFVS